MTIFRTLPSGARRRLPDGSVRALGANGPRYADVAGSTGMGIGAAARGSALVPLVGETRLMFGLVGDLEQFGLLGRTSLSIGVRGALSAAVVLQGAVALGFGLAGQLTRSAPLAGATAVSVRIVGDLAIAQPLRGTVRLTFGATGRLTPRRVLRGRTGLGIGLVGNLTVATGGKWRDLWLDLYDKRQALLNKIDEQNRNLAKDAGAAANAAAQAVVITNTRIDTVDGRVTAEANRTTALTTRVTNAENTNTAQGAAISSLQSTSTAQGNLLTSHSQQLTNVSASITGLDGRVTNVANTTVLLSAEVDSLGAAKSIWGLYQNVNGLVTGMQSINDGIRGEINFLTDAFRLLSPGAQNGMEVLDGYMRVWRGATQVIIGNGFGTSGDLMFYAGPNVGVGSASKQNGTIWFDSAGNSYFGGTLSAGILKNAAQSSQVSTGAQVETGPFGTNGNAKVIACSLSYDNAGFVDQNLGNAALSATVVLERSYNGGGWTEIGRMNATGNRVVDYEEPGLGWYTSWSLGGALTTTDQMGGTGTFNYRLRIIAASGGWPHIVGGSPGTQRLALVSTEQ